MGETSAQDCALGDNLEKPGRQPITPSSGPTFGSNKLCNLCPGHTAAHFGGFMMGEGWHKDKGEAAKLTPLPIPSFRKKFVILSFCLIRCLAVALQIPWARAETTGP